MPGRSRTGHPEQEGSEQRESLCFYPLYILPFPGSSWVQLHWIKDGKGRQEILGMPARMRKEARGKKSQGSRGKVSDTHCPDSRLPIHESFLPLWGSETAQPCFTEPWNHTWNNFREEKSCRNWMLCKSVRKLEQSLSLLLAYTGRG